MDGGDGDVYCAGWVVIGNARGASDRKVIFILAEDVGAEDGEVDVVHGDLTHLWQVDGHLSGLQVEQTGLVDDCGGEKERTRWRERKIIKREQEKQDQMRLLLFILTLGPTKKWAV